MPTRLHSLRTLRTKGILLRTGARHQLVVRGRLPGFRQVKLRCATPGLTRVVLRPRAAEGATS